MATVHCVLVPDTRATIRWAEGVGATAQYDGQQNVVWLTLGNSRGFVRVP